MEIASKDGDYAAVAVSSELISSICIQDTDTGDAVYIDRSQAEKLLPVLRAFAETGEMPK